MALQNCMETNFSSRFFFKFVKDLRQNSFLAKKFTYKSVFLNLFFEECSNNQAIHLQDKLYPMSFISRPGFGSWLQIIASSGSLLGGSDGWMEG